MTEYDDTTAVCAADACTRPAAPGATLCAPDVRRLGDWLAKIGDEYTRLSAMPSMQGREVGTIGGTTLTSQRSVGLLHVMALRSRTRGSGRIGADDADAWGLDDTPSVFATLATYAELVRAPVEDGGRGLVPPRIDLAYVRTARPAGPVCDPEQPRCGHHTCEVWTYRANVYAPLTVTSERQLLATHLEWIVGQDWAGEFFDDMRGLWGLLLRANGHVAVRRVHRLQAPCQGCGVRALTHRPGDDCVRCESCGAGWKVPELNESNDEKMSA